MNISSVHKPFVCLVVLTEKFIQISPTSISSPKSPLRIHDFFEVDLSLESAISRPVFFVPVRLEQQASFHDGVNGVLPPFVPVVGCHLLPRPRMECQRRRIFLGVSGKNLVCPLDVLEGGIHFLSYLNLSFIFFAFDFIKIVGGFISALFEMFVLVSGVEPAA
jgi:hypothetical protein